MGICHMYKFTGINWHYCTYNGDNKNTMTCHKKAIEDQLMEVQTR